MEQPKLIRPIQQLRDTKDTVNGTPVAVGKYFFRYIHNKQLGLAAMLFTLNNSAEYSTDDVVAAVAFRVNSKWPVVEVAGAWMDPGYPDVPFSATVVAYCTTIFRTWSVPLDNVFDVSAFSLTPVNKTFLYDYSTGWLISEWVMGKTGIVTTSGTYHPSKVLVGFAEVDAPPRVLYEIRSSKVEAIKQ